MTDETTIDLGALAALCEQHPKPYEVKYDAALDEDGALDFADGWTYESIRQGDCYAYIEECEGDHDFLDAMATKANAVPGLLALLAAREARVAVLESLLRERGITVPA